MSTEPTNELLKGKKRLAMKLLEDQRNGNRNVLKLLKNPSQTGILKVNQEVTLLSCAVIYVKINPLTSKI